MINGKIFDNLNMLMRIVMACNVQVPKKKIEKYLEKGSQ